MKVFFTVARGGPFPDGRRRRRGGRCAGVDVVVVFLEALADVAVAVAISFVEEAVTVAVAVSALGQVWGGRSVGHFCFIYVG